MCTTVVVFTTYLKWLSIFKPVRTTFNEKMKNILTSKPDDNNSFLSTKDYHDVIEQVKKSKMCLKTVGEAKTMKDYRVVRISKIF